MVEAQYTSLGRGARGGKPGMSDTAKVPSSGAPLARTRATVQTPENPGLQAGG